MNRDIHVHTYQTTQEDRHEIFGHRSPVIWLTGLSGSGKSSIANALQHKLLHLKVHTTVLDGDNFRSGLTKDLGFSIEDRQKNIERVAHVAKLFSESGTIAIVAFISPTIQIREMAKEIIGENNFLEIFINTPIEICEQRDPKGLYQKARTGEIQDFTGITSPYEAPLHADLILHSGEKTIKECTNELIEFLYQKNIINKK